MYMGRPLRLRQGVFFLATHLTPISGGNAQRSPGSDVDDHAGVGRHVIVWSTFSSIVSRVELAKSGLFAGLRPSYIFYVIVRFFGHAL